MGLLVYHYGMPCLARTVAGRLRGKRAFSSASVGLLRALGDSSLVDQRATVATRSILHLEPQVALPIPRPKHSRLSGAG